MTKVIVSLPTDLMNRVEALSTIRDDTVTDTIIKSLETELFLAKEEQMGSTPMIEKFNGKIVRFHWKVHKKWAREIKDDNNRG